MKTSFPNYNPLEDIQEVDQFGYVDLVKAFENGYVPGDADIREQEFNDIEDPASIVGKPSDAFEAMRMQDALVDGIKSAKSAAAKQSSDMEEN